MQHACSIHAQACGFSPCSHVGLPPFEEASSPELLRGGRSPFPLHKAKHSQSTGDNPSSRSLHRAKSRSKCQKCCHSKHQTAHSQPRATHVHDCNMLHTRRHAQTEEKKGPSTSQWGFPCYALAELSSPHALVRTRRCEMARKGARLEASQEASQEASVVWPHIQTFSALLVATAGRRSARGLSFESKSPKAKAS